MKRHELTEFLDMLGGAVSDIKRTLARLEADISAHMQDNISLHFEYNTYYVRINEYDANEMLEMSRSHNKPLYEMNNDVRYCPGAVTLTLDGEESRICKDYLPYKDEDPQLYTYRTFLMASNLDEGVKLMANVHKMYVIQGVYTDYWEMDDSKGLYAYLTVSARKGSIFDKAMLGNKYENNFNRE